VIAVDLPSGLHGTTGRTAGVVVQADWTLSLLTLKPGQFLGKGRDQCGELWLNDLNGASVQPSAWLNGTWATPRRPHDSHKGSYGDVTVVGGTKGMTGAALLAASAALHGGAGRVLLGLLDSAAPTIFGHEPEIMIRQIDQLDLHANTVVCGCGGGAVISDYLTAVLTSPKPVVLDADALNAVAANPEFLRLLQRRAGSLAATVITPHPLEAGRLLNMTASQVQDDRIASAQKLAFDLQCVVVLKGSGTVIAAPGELPVINATGNAELATAGTGDVLAGLIGARLATGCSATDAACRAVYLHGATGDLRSERSSRIGRMTASELAHLLR